MVETETYLKDKIFKFPFSESFFNLYSDDANVFFEELNDKLFFPYLSEYMLALDLELE